MRRTVAALAVATALAGAVPAASAAAASDPTPGCRPFAESVANAVRFGYIEPESPFGQTVSLFAHTFDGNPLRFDREEDCVNV
jgi:hypothetical protein